MVVGGRGVTGVDRCSLSGGAGFLLARRSMDRWYAGSSRPAWPPKCAPPTRPGMKDLALNLDETVLSRPRLSILAALVSGDAVDFTFLQKNLGISDGNLSTHLRKLEAENYIRSEKVLVNRKPKTWFQITAEGRRALEQLFRQLEEMLTSNSNRRPQPESGQ